MIMNGFFSRFGMTPLALLLLLSAALLSVALPVADLTGILPIGVVPFLGLFVLLSTFATYRPGWVFLFLVTILPFETVSLAPEAFPADIRPYQLLTVAVFAGLGIRVFFRREVPGRPKFGLADALLALVPIGAFLSATNAPDSGGAFRLAVILLSFYGIYLLFRLYVRSSEDVGRIFPFVILSVAVTAVVAITQNIVHLSGTGSCEVMPGRPNAFFAEPDWLGMFLVSSFALLMSSGYLIVSRSDSFRHAVRTRRTALLYLTFSLVLTALILSVSRSAWLGASATLVVALLLVAMIRSAKGTAFLATLPLAAFLAALSSTLAVPLTDFDLSGRAGSIGSGRQTVTVSCFEETALPDRVATVEELTPLGCRHIDLEEIPAEIADGRFITEIERDDPNVSIRKNIYGRSLSMAMEHPLLGAGWGTVTSSLGTDGRGAGLNASNVFLEVWLGSGFAGLFGLVGFLFLLAFRAFADFRVSKGVFPLFLLSSFAGLVVFDLFNSGILLGFFWALLGIAGSYLSREEPFTETI